MDNNTNETAYSDNEKRIVSRISLLYWLTYAFNFEFIAYIFVVEKIGAYHIWIVFSSVIASVILAVVCAIVYFKKARFIKKFQKTALVLLISISVLTVGNVVFDGKDYFIDIFCGKTKVTTNEYFVTNTYGSLEFIGNDGRKTSVRVSNEMKKKLNQNELISHSFEESYSDNKLCYYKEKISVEYYPHCLVLVQLDFVE